MIRSIILLRNQTSLIWFLFLFFLPSVSISQQHSQLTISETYQLAKKNYPLIKQRDLIKKTRQYSVSNAAKGYLPALTINGQGTYQSDVTNLPFKIPIAGFTLPTYSKDQYKIYGEVDQTIYDGGVIKNQKQAAEINETIAQQNLEVELYALYDRINQLYFGALLVDEQLKHHPVPLAP